MRGYVRAAALLLLLGVTSVCQFERRPDLTEGPVTEARSATTDAAATSPEDSVRVTVRAVTNALATSDSALVVSLTTPDAVLIDHAMDLRWTRTAGGPLPGPLVDSGNGLRWSVEDITIALLTDGSALLSGRFTVPGVPGSAPSSAVETWLAIRTDSGWRVRYMHRSREAGRDRPAP